MGRIQVDSYQGNKIIYADFSGLRSEEKIIAVIEKLKSVIRNHPANSVLTLSNISGMHFNNRIKEIFAEFTKGNKKYIKSSAVIGASGLQNIILNSINKLSCRNIKSFNDEFEARNWLIGYSQLIYFVCTSSHNCYMKFYEPV